MIIQARRRYGLQRAFVLSGQLQISRYTAFCVALHVRCIPTHLVFAYRFTNTFVTFCDMFGSFCVTTRGFTVSVVVGIELNRVRIFFLNYLDVCFTDIENAFAKIWVRYPC